MLSDTIERLRAVLQRRIEIIDLMAQVDAEELDQASVEIPKSS